MARFIVRRSVSAIALLFAISVVVFGIFEVIPAYNPARAIAGRNATQITVNQVAKKFGFDKPFYIQYADTMKKIFTGNVIDYNTDLNVVDQFTQRFPVTLSLVIPAALLWLFFAVMLGLDQRATGGAISRQGPDGGGDRRSFGTDLPARRGSAVFLRLQAAVVPEYRLRAARDQRDAVGLSPDPALVLDRRPLGRLLLARAALEPTRHGQPGLRPHGPGQGPLAAPGVQAPRAAQLADADHHAVRAGLRHAARRRARWSPRPCSISPASVSTRPRRSQTGRPADPGGRDVHRVLRGAVRRRHRRPLRRASILGSGSPADLARVRRTH